MPTASPRAFMPASCGRMPYAPCFSQPSGYSPSPRFGVDGPLLRTINEAPNPSFQWSVKYYCPVTPILSLTLLDTSQAEDSVHPRLARKS